MNRLVPIALVSILATPGPQVLAESPQQEIMARVRRQKPAKTPTWVNAIPDRIGDLLVEKHWHRDGEVWGLAKRTPDSDLPYDEMGSATFLGLVRQYNLFDRVGALDEAARAQALQFWQSWQDPKTGRFFDPRDPERTVNEKYVVGTIHSLGGEPLYKWTTTGASKKIETDIFLARTNTDPDWARGGWSVGSHTGLMAVEILNAINDGQTELIPDLEKGLEQILSHQDPTSGLWGPPEAEPMRRIGGTLKVIGRVYFKMGMIAPHTRELADTLVEYQRSGKWFKHGEDSCVPRNVAEIIAYCLEASGYRRADLLDAMESLGRDYRHWVTPRGETLMHRDRPDDVGIQYTTLYGLGIVGGYLHWSDCRLPNPLANSDRGIGFKYRPVVTAAGRVQVMRPAPALDLR